MSMSLNEVKRLLLAIIVLLITLIIGLYINYSIFVSLPEEFTYVGNDSNIPNILYSDLWILGLIFLVSAIIGILELLSDCFKQRNVSKNNNKREEEEVIDCDD